MSGMDLPTIGLDDGTVAHNATPIKIDAVDQRVSMGVYRHEPLTKKYVWNGSGGEGRERIVTKLNNILNFNTKDLLTIRELALGDKTVEHRRKTGVKKGFRGTEIYNEAVRYGAQSALSSTINDFVLGIRDRQTELRSIYDFQSLMLNNGTVAPPVVSMSKGVVNVSGDMYQRIATKYKISEQARFVETPITFFSYFNFQDYEVAMPSKFDVPLTNNEMNYWRNGIYDGWVAGASQAALEIASSENRLNRDYLGMIRYRIMLLGNMVDKPSVSKNTRSTDVTTSTMDIGKVTLSMSDKIRFNPNDSLWQVLPMLDKLEESSLVDPNKKVDG